jgi:hypothetical protein
MCACCVFPRTVAVPSPTRRCPNCRGCLPAFRGMSCAAHNERPKPGAAARGTQARAPHPTHPPPVAAPSFIISVSTFQSMSNLLNSTHLSCKEQLYTSTSSASHGGGSGAQHTAPLGPVAGLVQGGRQLLVPGWGVEEVWTWSSCVSTPERAAGGLPPDPLP